MNRCTKCGRLFIFEGEEQKHTCPPRWEVWESTGERASSATRVFAADAEMAAEKWAEIQDDAGDYDIVSGRLSPVVCVSQEGSEEITRFRIEGESVPQYHAREI